MVVFQVAKVQQKMHIHKFLGIYARKKFCFSSKRPIFTYRDTTPAVLRIRETALVSVKSSSFVVLL